MIKFIKDSSGNRRKFDPEMIVKAIKRASDSPINYEAVVSKVIDFIMISYKAYSRYPTTGMVDDLVEKVLIEMDYSNVAKAYILQRENEDRAKDAKKMFKDSITMINEYIGEDIWEVNENSNMAYSVQGLNHHVVGKVVSNYWLNTVYSREIRQAHLSGDLHIHDLSELCGYCNGWDLADLLATGFRGAPGKVESGPAKHFNTAVLQMANFIFVLAGEGAGAQAFSNFDTLLAPYVRNDSLTQKEVDQIIQELLFHLNTSTRTGFQSPFSNITVDIHPSQNYRDQEVYIAGESTGTTYGDYQKEMDMINKALVSNMLHGDVNGAIFSFPIITVNIGKDFEWDRPGMEDMWELTAKYGPFYFANYVNSDLKPEDAVSMCCLRGDTAVSFGMPSIDDGTYTGRLSYSLAEAFKVCGGDIVDVSRGGESVKARFVKVPYGRQMYRLDVLVDGEKDALVTTDDHLNPTLHHGDVRSDEVTTSHTLIGSSNRTPVKILKITKLEEVEDFAYCAEVLEGEPYFDVGASGILTHNCRLRLDTKEINKRGGGLFGSNPLTGSVGVVTLNLPRLGFLSSTDDDFFERLDILIDNAKKSLVIKRKFIEKFTEQGLYPYSKFYLRAIKKRTGSYWTNHYNTIGIVGMHECCLNYLGVGIETDPGLEFAVKVMNYMRKRILELQESTGLLFNLEATPAESTAYRLALKDRELYPKIISSGEDEPYYTNSTNLPVDFTDDLFMAMRHQEQLQPLYTGGCVFHAFLGERLEDGDVTKMLVRKMCEQSEIPYISITPTFSICPDHGYIAGAHPVCPKC